MTRNCFSPRWTLGLTALAYFMVALDSIVVTTALPAVGHDLHADLARLDWAVNAYTLTYAAGIITAAGLGGRLGRRRARGGLGHCTLAAPLVLAGIGAAMAVPASAAALQAVAPADTGDRRFGGDHGD